MGNSSYRFQQLQNLYVDGTKIESRANRYTFVWKRSIEYFDGKLDEKVREFIAEAKRIAEEENVAFGENDLPELGEQPLSSQTLDNMAEKINEVIERLPESVGHDNGKKNSTR